MKQQASQKASVAQLHTMPHSSGTPVGNKVCGGGEDPEKQMMELINVRKMVF